MSKKNNILLSIGLIVKNEEENLARCLDSLKPIMEAIPCQLIITDTGSTDKTVEIAKDYTDEVYFFEWCDDFAAARNFGLEKAIGQWFMFIDADEWFEECKVIIDFFKSGEYKKYKNATYIVRNYINSKDKNYYEDQKMGRLYKISDEIRFQGIIHEYIPLVLPIKELNIFVNHFGYAIDNSKEYMECKHQRNLILILKEYEKNTENCRLIYLLAKQYLAGDDKKNYKELVDKFYAEHAKDYDNEYLPYFTYQLALIFKEQDKVKLGIEILKKYKNKQEKNEAWNLDILVALADLSLKEKNFKDSVKYGKEYFKLYEDYKQGKVATGISGIVTSPTFINDQSAITMYNIMINAYIQLGESQRALELIDCINFNFIIKEDLMNSLNLLFYIVFSENRFNILPIVYLKILKTQNYEKIYMYMEILEKNIVDYLPSFEAIAKQFEIFEELQTHFQDDNYVLLQKLRLYMLSNNNYSRKIAISYLERNNQIEISPIFSDFILFALLIPEFTDDVLKNIDIENIHLYLKKIVLFYGKRHYFLIYLISSLRNLKSNSNKRIQFWTICLMENILIYNPQMEVEVKKQLISIYIEKAYDYMLQIYNLEILCEDQIYIMPRSYRFIYYTHEAKVALSKGNKQGYILLLKKALSSYPLMVSVVELLLNSIDVNEEKNKIDQIQNKNEFDFYAKSVKMKIKELAMIENMREGAVQLLETYNKINPKDEVGIAELRLLLELDNKE